jgi:hypothetical protein
VFLVGTKKNKQTTIKIRIKCLLAENLVFFESFYGNTITHKKKEGNKKRKIFLLKFSSSFIRLNQIKLVTHN